MTEFAYFKAGKKSFTIHAFHPKNFEDGLYAVSINQNGKPLVDKYTYFKQIKAKNAKEAMDEVRYEFLAKLAKDMDTIERLERASKKVRA